MEEAEEASLAPWALRSATATRRRPLPPEGRSFEYRTAYQRDRDRLLYSRAFRRLRDKSQLYLAETEEQHRNRLTHTLEVSQVARTLARALRLNEDLAEAVALGHDLGRTPFGRSGERALEELLSKEAEGSEEESPAPLFLPNQQALRVVDLLEVRYEEHPGLNLTDEVRDGILRQMPGTVSPLDPDLDPEGLLPGPAPSLEAQAVGLADRLVSPVHDLDDALEAGDLPLRAVETTGAGRAVLRRLGGRYRGARGDYGRRNLLHRSFLHLLVTDAVVCSGQALEGWSASLAPEGAIPRREEIPDHLVRLSERAAAQLEELRRLVRTRVVSSRRVIRSDARAAELVRGLFRAYHENPRLLPDHLLLRYKSVARTRFLRDLPPDRAEEEIRERYRGRPAFRRLLADHLAAMTDRHALAEAGRLAGPPAGR
jgi:dGTPase